ncbi:MAG: hypothetical protein ACK50Q_01060 [Labrys sp. (in: a-proteobacteria)]
MRSDIQEFKELIGKVVVSIKIRLLFYKQEPFGYLAGVQVLMDDGREFELGCAGDGSVHAFLIGHNYGDAPDFFTVRRYIDHVKGIVCSIVSEGSDLTIQIENRSIKISNIDDEIAVLIDGAELSRSLLAR